MQTTLEKDPRPPEVDPCTTDESGIDELEARIEERVFSRAAPPRVFARHAYAEAVHDELDLVESLYEARRQGLRVTSDELRHARQLLAQAVRDAATARARLGSTLARRRCARGVGGRRAPRRARRVRVARTTAIVSAGDGPDPDPELDPCSPHTTSARRHGGAL